MKLYRIALGSILLSVSLGCASGGDVTDDDGDVSVGTQSGACPGCDSGVPPDRAGPMGTGTDEASAGDSGSPPGDPDGGDPDTSFLADTGTPIADSGGVSTDTACASTGTQSACADCCAADNPSSVPTLNSAIESCACGSTGGCATACATEVCVGTPATSGDACYTCLSNVLGATGACNAPVHTACAADPGCAAYLTCETMECSALPM